MPLPFQDFVYNTQHLTQLFMGAPTAGTFFTWHKPDNCTLIYIIAVGGGGGGGTGSAESTGVNSCGGGSGGAGAVAKIILPACMIPDTLFIQPGIGGAGGASSTGTTGQIGSSGTSSYVLVTPDAGLTAANILLASGSSVATGGGAGATNASGGAAGTGEAVASLSTAILAQYGLLCGGFTCAVAGQSGVVGGKLGSSVNITALSSSTNILTSAGGGGGQADVTNDEATNGGLVTVAGVLPECSAAAGFYETGATSTPSGGCIQIKDSAIYPFFNTGGGGGGGGINNAGNMTTGDGGAGGLGCGGGGSGGCMASSTRTTGAGGRGGDGYVLIQVT